MSSFNLMNKPKWLLDPSDTILTKNGKSYIYIKNKIHTIISDTPTEMKVGIQSPMFPSQHP